ncbi:zinc-binding dehydrogenase [Streptomyces varsoviensis]|uniref:NADPH:quinone reductase n=1 Tax=Streptomyces varsoviensis TaxID=67373 RepID=A0ABR5IXQ1_9ACTN|nr:zinc-binding dehydrogenase [Streptomyces varsoviensis]KOG85935.1 NADPH:quinone reductase [Streptomyces varsoviensis]
MKAVEIRKYGSPEGLALVDRPVPVPAEGEVLIATEAIGVGGVDAVIRSGAMASYGFKEGLIPGSEVAGTVTAVGGGVDAAWIGRRAWGFTGLSGAYAEQVAVPIEEVMAIPDALSADDAVTVGTSGVTTHFALSHAHLAPGEKVLIRGAGGSLGTLLVQLAALRGAGAVAVTTSSRERGARLRELGATHVLDRAGEVDREGVGDDAPERYDVIIDIVTGPDMPSFFDKLTPNGRLVAIGIVAGAPPADFGMKLIAAFQQSLTFATFSADTVPITDRRTVRAEQFAAVTRGELRPVIHDVLPLAQAPLAHHKMDTGEAFGRIVLRP